MMKKTKTQILFAVPTYLLFGFIFSSKPSQASLYERPTMALDSVGQEVVGGNRFVLHKIQRQETYYQLSRTYGVPVKEIMEANNKKNLRVGDTVRVPRGKATSTPSTATRTTEPPIRAEENNPPPQRIEQDVFTEYKVGKSETLYAISRRFDITVEELKKANRLTSNSVREGQLLKIPNASEPEPVQQPAEIIPHPSTEIEERQPIDDSDFKANKYGIKERKERGIGVWMDNLGDGQSLALHKSAPIGTILKITNPMNKSVTFAKVVGKFNDNQDTQDAIVVFSKAVATSVGILDRRFQIEIHYGTPLE